MFFKAVPPAPRYSAQEERSDPLSPLATSVAVFSSHRLGSNAGGFLSHLQFRGYFSFIYQTYQIKEKKPLS